MVSPVVGLSLVTQTYMLSAAATCVGAELGLTFWWQQDGLVDTGVVGVAGALETEVGVQCKGECGGLQGVVGWNSSAGATEGRTFATTGGGKAIDGSGAV